MKRGINKKLFVVIALMMLLTATVSVVAASEETTFGVSLATALFGWIKGLFVADSPTGMAVAGAPGDETIIDNNDPGFSTTSPRY